MRRREEEIVLWNNWEKRKRNRNETNIMATEYRRNVSLKGNAYSKFSTVLYYRDWIVTKLNFSKYLHVIAIELPLHALSISHKDWWATVVRHA